MKKACKSYEIIDVYCAHGDGGERSMGPVIGVFRSSLDASAAQKGQGWWGGDGGTTERKALIVTLKSGEQVAYLLSGTYGEPLDLDGEVSKARERIKQGALWKLTPSEKKALGLTKE